MRDVRETLIANGWRQGALISPVAYANLGELAHCHLDVEKDLFLVISQTCDLINHSFQDEPFFEVLRLSPLDGDSDPSKESGKNSRELHIEIDRAGEEKWFRVFPFERFFVRREPLLEHGPDEFLDDKKCDLICAWLVKRINRVAFPDNFDQRWKCKRRQIEKIIKRLKKVSGIYIKVEPFSEIDDGNEYDLEIYLLMDADDFDDADVYKEYDGYRKLLEEKFNECPGLNLRAIELVSDADITIRVLQEFSLWDYSYISYREPDEHAFPVDPP